MLALGSVKGMKILSSCTKLLWDLHEAIRIEPNFNEQVHVRKIRGIVPIKPIAVRVGKRGISLEERSPRPSISPESMQRLQNNHFYKPAENRGKPSPAAFESRFDSFGIIR